MMGLSPTTRWRQGGNVATSSLEARALHDADFELDSRRELTIGTQAAHGSIDPIIEVSPPPPPA